MVVFRSAGEKHQQLAAGEKRKRDDGATTPAPKLGVVRVEKATTGRGHCGWCDTQIEVGSPRVVKHQYHHAGKYSRNNGASTGYLLSQKFASAQNSHQMVRDASAGPVARAVRPAAPPRGADHLPGPCGASGIARRRRRATR